MLKMTKGIKWRSNVKNSKIENKRMFQNEKYRY